MSGAPTNEAGDRVAVARGIAEQLFESDLRSRKPIEATGDDALRVWQAFASRTSNRGLWQVIEQIDRCAFAERWSQMRDVYLEQGPGGVFEMLMRAATLRPDDAAELGDGRAEPPSAEPPS